MTRSLPPRPSLESLQKQAKQLLREHRSGDAEAHTRVQSQHPRPETFGGLRDAQLVLAREYGFAGWNELRDEVEARAAASLPATALASEFADLACLTYSNLESPRRVARAARLLEHQPRLVEADVFAAAAAGHVAALRRLLDADPARARGRGGPRDWSPLLYVAYSRVADAPPARAALAAARLLLERGADPNDHFRMNDSYRFSALTGAIGEGEQGSESQPPHAHARELAVLLLDAGASPNDGQGLYNSQFTPGDEWLELLLARGLTSRDRVNWDDGYALGTLDYLLCVAVTLGFAARVDLLLRHGADPNALDPYNKRSAYRNALRESRPEIAQRLLAAGARAEEPEPEDRMFVACRSGDAAGIAELGRAHPHLTRNPRLLVETSRNGRLDAVRALLDLGADVNGTVPEDSTPLHQAAMANQAAVAELLLERGAALDARDGIYDATPISAANAFGHIELRDALLARTRDVFDLAAFGRVEALAEVLRADPSLARARRAQGRTPLHRIDVAGERGAATIELLLRHGADLNARTDDGRTPLDTRVELELDEVADLLRERGAQRGVGS